MARRSSPQPQVLLNTVQSPHVYVSLTAASAVEAYADGTRTYEYGKAPFSGVTLSFLQPVQVILGKICLH